MAGTLQLVVPCYNEAGRLQPDAFLDLVAAHPNIGVVFVDDGSTDTTPAIIHEAVARSGGRMSAVTLNANAGKARAVQVGILAAFERHPEFVGFWDADLSTPLSAVPAFIDTFRARPDVDIVMGARVKLLGRRITRRLVRHYAGRVFATAASLVLGIAVYDTQCGAKIFRATDRVRQGFVAPFRSKWIFDVEILSRYIAAAGRAEAESRMCELPLDTWTDVAGSKLTLRQALRAAWDLALLARR